MRVVAEAARSSPPTWTSFGTRRMTTSRMAVDQLWPMAQREAKRIAFRRRATGRPLCAAIA